MCEILNVPRELAGVTLLALGAQVCSCSFANKQTRTRVRSRCVVALTPCAPPSSMLLIQVPDTIAAVSMARNKMYDGAITSAIGSQILNITLGMGVPFAVWSWTNDGRPMKTKLGNIHSVSVCLGVSIATYILSVVRCGGGLRARVTACGAAVMMTGYIGCNVYMVASMATSTHAA